MLPTVLLVDDDEVLGRSLRRIARPIADLVVVTSKAEALRAIEEGAFAGFLFDVDLGPGDELAGVDLMERARQRFPLSTVALLTGALDPSLSHRALENGSLFLRKPLPDTALFHFIRRTVRPSRSVHLTRHVDAFAEQHALRPRHRDLLLAAVLGEPQNEYRVRANITRGSYRNAVSELLAQTDHVTLADLVNDLCRNAID